MANPTSLRAVVAIPVCNEAERIGACLRALNEQAGLPAGALGIVLFLNNCRDATAAIVKEHRHATSFPIRVIERDRPDGHAGWARRAAMDAAATWLEEAGEQGGVILTTDADSRVPTDWVARNLAAIAAGADAVAGRIALDPAEAARLPERLHARGRLEGTYETLLIAISAAIDPDPHDPWPCHGTASGATLAVRSSIYRAVGGMPELPVGEDRAFVAALLAAGARVRHAPDITVITSGRLDGRAPGGAADTMRQRCEAPDSPCDPALQPLRHVLFRSLWKRRVRVLHEAGRLGGDGSWARALAIPRPEADRIATLDTPGRTWAEIEGRSPRLAARPLTPRELPAQIGLARAALAALTAARRASAALRSTLAASRAAASAGMKRLERAPGPADPRPFVERG